MSEQNLTADELTNDTLVPESLQHLPQVVILTGMSGAGRTEGMHVFEDLGYFCIDNLPAGLIDDAVEMTLGSQEDPSDMRIAIVCDTRNRAFFKGVSEQLKGLKEAGYDYRIVFLDADDEKLVSRYKSSRRRHPLCDDGMSISQGIQRERSLLYNLKEASHHVINTTDMLPQQLRATIRQLFSSGEEREGLSVSVYSFGFKHGPALDADIVIDVRFLPNPYWDPELRTLTGMDAPVRDFVMFRSETEEFVAKWKSLLDTLMPGYVKEGKQQLAIAVGCTGGQHRSVALAEATGDYLKSTGYRVSVAHRDLKLANKRG